MGYKEQLSNALEQITDLRKELLQENVLYANMKSVLKEREKEITELYNIINVLMARP